MRFTKKSSREESRSFLGCLQAEGVLLTLCETKAMAQVIVARNPSAEMAQYRHLLASDGLTPICFQSFGFRVITISFPRVRILICGYIGVVCISKPSSLLRARSIP
jgi:hypothetical protein